MNQPETCPTRPIRVKVSNISFVEHAPEVRSTRTSGKLTRIHDRTYVWIGKPVAPDASWTCGTDVVWPVLKLEGHDVQILDNVYVCRHMIEIGD